MSGEIPGQDLPPWAYEKAAELIGVDDWRAAMNPENWWQDQARQNLQYIARALAEERERVVKILERLLASRRAYADELENAYNIRADRSYLAGIATALDAVRGIDTAGGQSDG